MKTENNMVQGTFLVEILNLIQLTKVMKEVKEVPSVQDVFRKEITSQEPSL
jgi:hypothetical protein